MKEMCVAMGMLVFLNQFGILYFAMIIWYPQTVKGLVRMLSHRALTNGIVTFYYFIDDV